MADPKLKPPEYQAQDARQGEIILRTRTRRWVFIGSFCLALAIAVVLSYFIGR